jgi:hypothetical protein
VPGKSETRAPSTESLISILVRLVRRVLHRGMRADLASSFAPTTPFPRDGTISDLVQANDLPPRWTTRLAGPFGSPRSRRQDVTSPLLQPTFTSRALDLDTTSGDCPPVVVSKPTRLASRPILGEERCGHLTVRESTPDHLAVIRPPAAARLTARSPASARSTPPGRFRVPAGELRRFFGSPDALSTDIL